MLGQAPLARICHRQTEGTVYGVPALAGQTRPRQGSASVSKLSSRDNTVPAKAGTPYTAPSPRLLSNRVLTLSLMKYPGQERHERYFASHSHPVVGPAARCHAAPLELGGPGGTCGYKHGAPRGAFCRIAVTSPPCARQPCPPHSA